MSPVPGAGLLTVLIPDGETWDTVKVLRCLGQIPKVRVHVLSGSRFPLSRFSRCCTEVHFHRSKNDSERLQVVRTVAKKRGVDVVMPVLQGGVEFVERNRDAISEVARVVALPRLESLRLLLNKWSAYDYVQKLGIPLPESKYIGKHGDVGVLPDWIDGFEYPALLKPTSLRGGSGIVKLNSSADFRSVWQKGDGLAKGEDYVLQSFIHGMDLCLGVFCRDGRILAYTIQRSVFSSERYFGPQRIMEFVEDEQTLRYGEKLLGSLRYDGVAFVDFRIDSRDQRRKFIEVNPRIGQAVLGSMTAGVNFPLLWCLDAMEMPLPRIRYTATPYAHPAAFAKMAVGRLFRKQPPVAVGWRQSGLRFTMSDPLPELVDAVTKAIRFWR